MPNDRIRKRLPRGSTLLEVMAAMGVMLIGATGVAGLTNMGIKLDGDGRKMTRATAIAEDLANQIALWPYADARLSNPNTSNDDVIGDPTSALELASTSVSSVVDHAEADLTAGGAVWNGIPAADLAANGFERYWNVTLNDPASAGTLLDSNGDGVADGMRVAVIVRWPNGSGWRRIVILVTKANPDVR